MTKRSNLHTHKHCSGTYHQNRSDTHIEISQDTFFVHGQTSSWANRIPVYDDPADAGLEQKGDAEECRAAANITQLEASSVTAERPLRDSMQLPMADAATVSRVSRRVLVRPAVYESAMDGERSSRPKHTLTHTNSRPLQQRDIQTTRSPGPTHICSYQIVNAQFGPCRINILQPAPQQAQLRGALHRHPDMTHASAVPPAPPAGTPWSSSMHP